jgi:protocatechuate 3,4-dioxygenase beta subunit
MKQILSLAILLAFTGLNAAAQSTSSGTVSGQVTDPQGAALTGAEVRMTDPLTNITRTTLTNDAGRFSFIGVTPSVYDFVVSKPGFSQSGSPRKRWKSDSP